MVFGETDKKWRLEELRFTVREYLFDVVGLTFEEWQRIEVLNRLNIQSPEINAIVGTKGVRDNGIYYGGRDTHVSPVIFALKRVCMALDRKLLRSMGYRTDGKLIADIEGDGEILRLVLNIASYDTAIPNPTSLACQILIFAKEYGLNMKGVDINPRGDWNKCFGFADAGTTGRKLACDTQCSIFSHGGGALFGKDVSKGDYAIPLFLTYLAKMKAKQDKTQNVALHASTIIGDETVAIYDGSLMLYRAGYKELIP
jgi:S-adenosylmethionine synthetase